jgi:hypothetical protein
LFKLALNQKNTRKNPDDEQISPFSDPEKILKSRRHFRQTVSSTNKNYQPKYTQTDSEDQHSELSIPPLYGEYSADKVTSPESDLVLPIFETEAFSVVSHTNRKRRSVSLPVATDSPSLLEVHFPTSQNSNNYPIYLDSTSVDSPIFSPCESEGTSPHSPSSFFSSFIPIDNQLLETLPYNPQTFTAKATMAAAGAGGAGGAAAGGPGAGAGGQAPPLRIFTKVAARYAPLVLPVPLHDLPKIT